MKKLITIAALMAVCLPALAGQTSVWRSTLTRGTSGTFVQNVDAATPEAALQACHLLVPNVATAATEYTCNAAKRVYRVTPNCTVPVPRPGTCPAGTTGSWTQTATVGAWPSCTVTWSSAPANACVTNPPPATDTATLRWTPPTHNVDGTSLSNLAGYRVVYGRSPTELVSTIQINNPGVSTYTVNNLAPGGWYFALKSFTSNGTESDLSNVAPKIIQ